MGGDEGLEGGFEAGKGRLSGVVSSWRHAASTTREQREGGTMRMGRKSMLGRNATMIIINARPFLGHSSARACPGRVPTRQRERRERVARPASRLLDARLKGGGESLRSRRKLDCATRYTERLRSQGEGAGHREGAFSRSKADGRRFEGHPTQGS